ncbi:DUF2007 domain-containing protein [Biformimicrobium ophioploci]|uniref:DUF2007 domain-containing protein n=1 Tax=Biformimicrobium ophioploci TaxID=3036711 RepID=A0ABQ6LWQ3_9GAMM|nr:DUF2007 domain-containing protein [Microbulbifer sp. NKW57]GMG86488.1 DUF2007 domain-containing protein [Microbulbifer sp. NKW57]
MKLVYTHENILMAGNIKALLEREGIEVRMKNEYAGGGRGDLPVFDTWPEVWVVDERDYTRAEKIIAQVSQAASGVDWHCPRCGEANAQAFEVCWHCQAERP